MPADLDRLRTLLARAVPGPWQIERRDGHPGIDRIIYGGTGDACWVNEDPVGTAYAKPTAELITEAVNALPELLEEVRLLRKVAEAASEAIVPQYSMPANGHERAANRMHEALSEWKKMKETPNG